MRQILQRGPRHNRSSQRVVGHHPVGAGAGHRLREGGAADALESRIDEGRCSKVTNRADAREAKWSKAAPHIARPRRLTIAQTYLPEVRERKEF